MIQIHCDPVVSVSVVEERRGDDKLSEKVSQASASV